MSAYEIPYEQFHADRETFFDLSKYVCIVVLDRKGRRRLTISCIREEPFVVTDEEHAMLSAGLWKDALEMLRARMQPVMRHDQTEDEG